MKIKNCIALIASCMYLLGCVDTSLPVNRKQISSRANVSLNRFTLLKTGYNYYSGFAAENKILFNVRIPYNYPSHEPGLDSNPPVSKFIVADLNTDSITNANIVNPQDTKSDDLSPTISRQGKVVFYKRNTASIYEMDLNLSHENSKMVSRVPSLDILTLKWSNQGDKVLLDDSAPHIRVLDMQTKHIHSLHNRNSESIYDLKWKYDDSEVFFDEDRPAYPDDPFPNTDILSMNLATRKVTPVLSSAPSESAPVFHPDSQDFLYVEQDISSSDIDALPEVLLADRQTKQIKKFDFGKRVGLNPHNIVEEPIRVLNWLNRDEALIEVQYTDGDVDLPVWGKNLYILNTKTGKFKKVNKVPVDTMYFYNHQTQKIIFSGKCRPNLPCSSLSICRMYSMNLDGSDVKYLEFIDTSRNRKFSELAKVFK